ncbi:MAG: phosphoglucosamine mutase [Dehalococcoidales bacterium]|nr:phosphoglucosamine mutase [Dehalococcoidales bacterium]
MSLFGSSGIRTIADRNLVQLAFRVGLVVGKSYGKVVVGRDTRTSGETLRHAVTSGLLAAGADCSDIGIAPTPTLAFVGRQFDASIMITASHNPPEYNGLKLINPDGSAFGPAQQKQVEEALADDSLPSAPWQELKNDRPYYGAIDEHIERIIADCPKMKLKVVVDAGCGAASLVTPHLLRKLGCEVIAIDCYPSGFFPRGIEPVESNLANLMAVTRESGADLGIAHDGDADRMMAVDDRGRFISGDKLLVILAQALKAKKVVITVDASMAIDEAGFKVRRTRVGDSFVSEELKRGGDFGGEASGAWVFPGVSLCPDGIYAAAKIAAIANRQKLSALVDSIPAYSIVRGSVKRDGTNGLEDSLTAMEPLSIDTVDGVKLNFKDGWVLVRPSGTEPKIRLTAEARTEKRAQQLYDSALKAIKGGRF